MGAKESKEIKIINTLNKGINLSNIKINNDDKYKSYTDRYTNIYKRSPLRRTIHTMKNLEDEDKNENTQKFANRRRIMTKEQRNLLKSILKENVKENKKAIAKNLIGVFLESKKNNKKYKIKTDLISNNNNKLENRHINQTPKSKLYIKTERDEKNASNKSIKKIKIKRFQTLLNVKPSKFSNYYKKQKELDELKNKEKNKENKQNNKENEEQNKEQEEENENINKIGKIKSEGLTITNDVNKNKMNFTSLFKMHQEIAEIQTNPQHKFATPRGPIFQPSIEKKMSIEDKKGIIFQRKSFRDFVENNNKKNYDECLKFINSTQIISHIDESDKSLLIQSLKIKNINKGECILKANGKCTVIFFVKHGLLQCVDDEGTCIKALTTGEYFWRKRIIIRY